MTSRRVRLDNYALPDAPRLGWRGWARWAWRQVTSMRVALLLLLLLGLAAIPGSVLPQRRTNAPAVARYIADHPAAGPWLDRAELFDVYGSAWFTAIYLLLFLSLVGCIVPRTVAHARSLAAPPSEAPRSLERYGNAATITLAGPNPAEAVDRAREALRGYRTRVDTRAPGRRASAGARGEVALSAENGSWRETGNVLFHLALAGLLVCMGLGSFLTFRGQVILVEGGSFTNAIVSYDSFEAGRGFRPERLEPFTLTLDHFDAVFDLGGAPRDFAATVTVAEPGRTPRTEVVRVNTPLAAGGASVYLQGNGYAPALTVRDADGNVAASGPVPFLPRDGVYTSTGVIKVPDVTSGPQIGIRATLLPTAVVDGDTAISLAPDPLNPVIVFSAFVGDLGLDSGIPQNVYVLDEARLSPVRGADGQPAVFLIAPGETIELPDGLGTVTWDALPRFVALDLRSDPTLPWLAACAVLALAGLATSLFAPDRRVWVLASSSGGSTVVTAAALGPAHDDGLAALLARVEAAIRREGE